MERRQALGLIAATGAAAAFPALPASAAGTSRPAARGGYTFALDRNVTRTSVRFRNRYGLTVAGDLYVPRNARGRLPALVVSGPFGAVKEQSSGLYANEFARRGYVTLAFDPSFTGESGGAVRDVASPDIYTEDFSAAVDFLGLQRIVDRQRIGVQAICGLSGMALTAAAADSRIKAVATASMYDMSRSMSRGHEDYYTPCGPASPVPAAPPRPTCLNGPGVGGEVLDVEAVHPQRPVHREQGGALVEEAHGTGGSRDQDVVAGPHPADFDQRAVRGQGCPM